MGLALVLWYLPFWWIHFSTLDDVMHALDSRSLDALAAKFSRVSELNRLSFYPITAISALPHLFGLPAVFYTLKALGFFFSVWAFYQLVSHFSGSAKFGLLTTLALVLVTSHSWQHSLLTSYPLVFHVLLGCLFLALRSFDQAPTSSRHLCLSLVLFGICLVSYEAFFPYLGIFLLIGLFRRPVEWRPLAAMLGVTFGVLGLHVWVRGFTYNTAYSGNSLSLDWAKVLLTYQAHFIGSIPGYIAQGRWSGIGLGELASHFSMRDWLVFIVAVVGLTKVAPLPREAWRKCLAIGLAMVFLPNVVTSFSQKFHEWAGSGNVTYLTSNFGFYGYALVVTGALAAFAKSVWWARALRFGVIGLVAINAGWTFVDNRHVVRSMRTSDSRWALVEKYCRDHQDTIVDGTAVELPELDRHYAGNVPLGKDYWQRYIRTRTGKKIILQ